MASEKNPMIGALSISINRTTSRSRINSAQDDLSGPATDSRFGVRLSSDGADERFACKARARFSRIG